MLRYGMTIRITPDATHSYIWQVEIVNTTWNGSLEWHGEPIMQLAVASSPEAAVGRTLYPWIKNTLRAIANQVTIMVDDKIAEDISKTIASDPEV